MTPTPQPQQKKISVGDISFEQLDESTQIWITQILQENLELKREIRTRPHTSTPRQVGLWGITTDEIGKLIDLTENSCFEEDREKQVVIARERIDLINEIKARGTVPETTPLISFGADSFKQHNAATAQSARDQVLQSLLNVVKTREDEMARKANLTENMTTAIGYFTSAGALNWVVQEIEKSLRTPTKEHP
jgi:hypothetical protein